MANWLLDYIEMTEYIPVEFRDQSFLMRELDLQVSNKMSQLEEEIKEFFSKFDKMNADERQEQYNVLLGKCDEASQAASQKIKLADRLHDLVEKIMRLLDQGLEKLKEDLIEGDKAYIVEDIERRSMEVDQQLRSEEDSMIRRQESNRRTNHNYKSHNYKNSNIYSANNLQNHRNSIAVNQIPHKSQNIGANSLHNRGRNNSTGTQLNGPQRPKKRERKRLNSTMTIFNRNSAIRTDDDSTNQTFISSPSTPEYLVGLHNSSSNSLNDLSAGDNNTLALKGMYAGNKNMIAGTNDKINGIEPILVKARQPILTAIDAAHAVSPNAPNSDKLILFPGQSNSDNHYKQQILAYSSNTNPDKINRQPGFGTANQHLSQLSSHSLAQTSNHGSQNLGSLVDSSDVNSLNFRYNMDKKSANFASLPLSSRHDPLYMAASQAINATQNMTSGRRTSSLKASYAAVNSGRIRSSNSMHPIFDQGAVNGEVYCKCRGTKHDPNMIACDNSNCKIEWFHYECVGITTPPDGEWFCDDCRTSTALKSSINKNLKRTHEIPVTIQASAMIETTPIVPESEATGTVWEQ